MSQTVFFLLLKHNAKKKYTRVLFNGFLLKGIRFVKLLFVKLMHQTVLSIVQKIIQSSDTFDFEQDF